MSGLRDALSFFSIFPLGKGKDLGDSIIFYFTVSGFIIAIVPAGLFYLFSLRLHTIAASAISLSVLLVISGFTHLDGVLDSGDALMARGTREHRIEVLKDRYTGAGAVGTVLVIYLTYFAVLSGFSPYYGFAAVIIGEMTSKLSLTISTGYFPSIGEGLARMFSDIYMRASVSPAFINALPLMIAVLILSPPALIGVLLSMIAYGISARLLRKSFGGLNGDLMALLGEISRVIFIISFALILTIPAFKFTFF